MSSTMIHRKKERNQDQGRQRSARSPNESSVLFFPKSFHDIIYGAHRLAFLSLISRSTMQLIRLLEEETHNWNLLQDVLLEDGD